MSNENLLQYLARVMNEVKDVSNEYALKCLSDERTTLIYETHEAINNLPQTPLTKAKLDVLWKLTDTLNKVSEHE